MMRIIAPVRDGIRTPQSLTQRQYFDSPQPAGRRITAGFTYLQRVSKAARYDVWFPQTLQRDLETQIALGHKIGAVHFPAEWAAVRQFELLHESGNHKIYDLDPAHLQRATLDLTRSMRAGGYRVVVALLGRYEKTSLGDELKIIDHRLQERISQMIHMLYLDEQSSQANAANDAKLAAQNWNYSQVLPHVSMAFGAHELFQARARGQNDNGGNQQKQKGKGEGADSMSHALQQCRRAQEFFSILEQLPQNQIVHDTAIGLQLPESNSENQWNYIASSDETLASFNHVLNSLFDKFDGISLSRLHERADATSEIKASTLHLRGYGDHVTEVGDKFYRRASLAFNA